MQHDIKRLLEKIDSELLDIYQSYDTANDLLCELEMKLDEQEIIPAGTSWSHLSAETRSLRYRLWDNLTEADKELLDHICDIIDALEKAYT